MELEKGKRYLLLQDVVVTILTVGPQQSLVKFVNGHERIVPNTWFEQEVKP